MCAVEGCDRGRQARDWCKMHWKRWRKHGDPLGMAPRYADPHERFLENTEPLPWTGCLVWAGARSDTGYGTMSVNGKTTLMHRWAYEQDFGEIPEGMLVDHRCHERLCVNIDHLRLATPAENVYHRRGANRRRGQKGLPRGVHQVGADRFVANVRHNRKTRYLGRFDTPEEAALVATGVRQRLFGEEFAGHG